MALSGVRQAKAAIFQSEIGDGLFTVLVEFPVCAAHLEIADTGQGFKLKPDAMRFVTLGTRRGYDSAVFDFVID